ncbi:hypothetical protein GO491_05590 [Flavobacteriaceae bacterium Ap0902]|nr:hypothetical protein [Flavobacteriaceae bacterium Ap0902]
MKMYRTVLMLLMVTMVFIGCSEDDDAPLTEELLPQDVRNTVDDEVMELILNDYYLNEQGKLTRFSDTDVSDDEEVPLRDLATYNPIGFWTVKRPDHSANGRRVVDVNTEKILLQYDMFTFMGRTNEARDSTFYSPPARFSSTINATGYPSWDPNFYYKPLSEAEIENNVERSWYEIEGFQEGIRLFNASNKEADAQPFVDFQGLVIIPSRLAFGRERNAFGLRPDQSVIINFELYKVEDR